MLTASSGSSEPLATCTVVNLQTTTPTSCYRYMTLMLAYPISCLWRLILVQALPRHTFKAHLLGVRIGRCDGETISSRWTSCDLHAGPINSVYQESEWNLPPGRHHRSEGTAKSKAGSYCVKLQKVSTLFRSLQCRALWNHRPTVICWKSRLVRAIHYTYTTQMHCDIASWLSPCPLLAFSLSLSLSLSPFGSPEGLFDPP